METGDRKTSVYNLIQKIIPSIFDIALVFFFSTIITFTKETVLTEQTYFPWFIILLGAFLLPFSVVIFRKVHGNTKEGHTTLAVFSSIGLYALFILLFVLGRDAAEMVSGSSEDTMNMIASTVLVFSIATYIAASTSELETPKRLASPKYLLLHISALLILTTTIIITTAMWQDSFTDAIDPATTAERVLWTAILTPLFALVFASPRIVTSNYSGSLYQKITLVSSLAYVVWLTLA